MKLLLTAVMLMLTATAGHAAGACGGDQTVTMRVSKLSASGTPAGFLDAVKDHKAWYASHGMKDDAFVTAPTLVAAKGGMKPSASSYVTFHTYGAKEPVHDAAWDAYVAKYKANATIDSETHFCLPKGAVIGR
jgi:hypothetical protein